MEIMVRYSERGANVGQLLIIILSCLPRLSSSHTVLLPLLDSDFFYLMQHATTTSFHRRHSIVFDIYSLQLLNKVEYQCYPSLKWKPSLFEASVIQQLLHTQFQNYLTRVKSTDCQAELKRLLKSGPPIYIYDKHGLPLDEEGSSGGDTHVCKLWFASDGKERSAKLTNALEGEERERLWQELKEFVIMEGKEVGDDDDNDDEDKKDPKE